MADIAMCLDHECPSRVHCYRYRAKPSEWQSYAGFKHEGERCEAYSSTSGWDDWALVPMSALEWQAKVKKVVSMSDLDWAKIAQRFESKVCRTKGCWIWTASLDRDGYGRFMLAGKARKAPRIAWVLHHKTDIPSSMVVCHECDNPQCVRPEHLFLATQYQNTQDMTNKLRCFNSKKTHCKRGHILSGDNLGLSKGKVAGKFYRWCRECARAGARRRWIPRSER